jgi:hypothetical protein
MIKSAAIKRIADGKIWTGRNHGDIIRTLIIGEGVDYVTRENFIKGFISESRGFVDRRLAMAIAICSGQIAAKNSRAELYSEMLVL